MYQQLFKRLKTSGGIRKQTFEGVLEKECPLKVAKNGGFRILL